METLDYIKIVKWIHAISTITTLTSTEKELIVLCKKQAIFIFDCSKIFPDLFAIFDFSNQAGRENNFGFLGAKDMTISRIR